ncbi:MAG: hypothetical protein CL572_01175 [Alphaproteobacteria bacterium]|nr:hypothetical protein [Alphaproteobacteria bacterium]
MFFISILELIYTKCYDVTKLKLKRMLFLIIFCLIQGFSEFLPISSQGHLIVYNHFFYLDEFSELSILELNVISHLGSLFAVVLYYNRLLFRMFKGLRVFYRPDLDKNLSLLFNLVVSTIPIVIFGYIFGKYFNYDDDNLILIIGITSVLFAIILFILDKYCLLVRNQEAINSKLALYTGFLQCLALIPGVSRSGAIMIALRSLGFNRNFTVRYSNLLSIPVILGATVFIFSNGNNNLFIDDFLNLSVIIVFFLSFLFSIIFIHFLITWVRKSSLFIFIIYRIFFGSALIIFFFNT